MAKEKICAYKNCKKIFQAQSNQKYCSYKCYCSALREREALKPKPCKWCGTYTTNKNRLCSTTCTLIYNNTHCNNKKITKNNTELARINALARETGLSYGKYVGKMYARGIKIL